MMCGEQTRNVYGNHGYDQVCGPTKSVAELEETLRISGAQLDQLELENARVVTQLKEVIKMNNHWQRYDSQREEYVIKLTQDVQDLTFKVSELEHKLNKVNIAKATRNEDKTQMNIKAHKDADNGGINMPAGELSAVAPPSSSSQKPEEKNAVLTAHIIDLKKHIELLERGKKPSSSPRHGEDADDEQVAMMREQINVCIEDFKQERRDRERFHDENQKLKERLAQAEQCIMKNEEQMNVYQEQIQRLQEERQQLRPVATRRPLPRSVATYDEPGCYIEDRPYRQKSPFNPRKTYRHPMNLGDDLTDLGTDLEDDVEVDGVPEDEADGLPPAAIGGKGEGLPQELQGAQMEAFDGGDRRKALDDEPLECPRCLASFPIDRHVDLLEHINRCLE